MALLLYAGLVAAIVVGTATVSSRAAAGRLLAQDGLAACGITLLMAGPLLVALLATRFRSWRWAALGMVAVTGDWSVQNVPLVGPFADLHWNWHGKVLATVAVLGFTWTSGSLRFQEIGVTSRLKAGWWKPLAVYAAAALAIWVFASGGRKPTWDAETFWFQATMPGLSEELAVRGVFLALLTRAFGQWRTGRHTAWGWPVVLSCVYFAVGHIVRVSPDLELSFKVSVWPTGLWGLLYWWMRERTGSVWPAVIVHNLSNLQMLATYVPWGG